MRSPSSLLLSKLNEMRMKKSRQSLKYVGSRHYICKDCECQLERKRKMGLFLDWSVLGLEAVFNLLERLDLWVTCEKCWYFGEWALYGIKPLPTKPSVRRYWWPSVNSRLFTYLRVVWLCIVCLIVWMFCLLKLNYRQLSIICTTLRNSLQCAVDCSIVVIRESGLTIIVLELELVVSPLLQVFLYKYVFLHQ